MKGWPILLLAALVLAAPAAMAVAAEADVQTLPRELKGETAAQTRTPEQLEAACGTVLTALLPDLGAADLGKRASAQNALETICLRAGRPGAETDRAPLCRAIAAQLPAASTTAKAWLVRQLQYVGKAECATALAALLADADANVAESARRALQANPSAEAAEALRAALAKADKPESRIAFINAVAGRRDPAGVAAIARFAADKDEAVARAAIVGLGRIGTADAHRALNAAKGTAAGKMRLTVLDALLVCAEQFAADGKKMEAGAIYRELSDSASPDAVRVAAFRGTVLAQGDRAASLLTDALGGKDAALRAVALSMISEVPGPAATKAFAGILGKLPPAEQALMLTELAARGDAAAKSAVLESLKSKDNAVRGAAVRAMADIGGAADVPALVQMVAGLEGKDRDAIVETLGRLRGKDVDAAVARALEGAAAPKVRTDLIRCLAKRRAEGAAPAILRMLAAAEESVRLEAAQALGVLGDEKALAPMAALLSKTTAEEDRASVVRAMVSICGRATNKEACAGPLVTAFTSARGPVRANLLEALSKTGSPRALDAVRIALKDTDGNLQETALKMLAEWPDAGPAAELLALARTSPKAAHQVIALRGYVRMVGISNKPPAEKAKMYQDAMAAVKRPEEKKMLLAAFGESPSRETLDLARSMLADETLKAEAAQAVVKIAVGIAASYRDEARAAIDQALQVSGDENLKKQAQEALNVLEKNEDFVTAWLLSGPYRQEGKDGPALFDVAFPPEEGDGSKAKWTALPASAIAPEAPGVVNFVRFMGGDNRAVYLKAAVFVPKAQEARLEIGSDDGVKVWVNGKVVHANNVSRAVKAGEDKVKVALAEGWNRVLMKITNGNGDWGACLRVRKDDGSRIEGIQVKPEPDK